MSERSKHLTNPSRSSFGGEIAVVLLLFAVGLSFAGINAISSWKELSREISESEESVRQFEMQQADLSAIRAELGYGGFIHHFKNYLLRDDEGYRQSVEADRARLTTILERAKEHFDLDEEQLMLNQVGVTVERYFRMLPTIDASRAGGDTASEIADKFTIDDKPARDALAFLDERVGERLEIARETMQGLRERVESVITLTVAGYATAVVLALLLLVAFRRSLKIQRNLEEKQVLLDAGALRYHSVLATAADAIIIANERGRILEVNRAAEKMFGYSPDEFIGNNLSMLMTAVDAAEHDHYIHHYVETGKPKVVGMVNRPALFARRRDGSQFPVEIHLSEANTEGGRLFTGIISDVSERKEAEMQLRRHSENLAMLNDIAANAEETLVARLEYALDIALHHLALEIGVVSQIEGQNYTVLGHVTPDDFPVSNGQVFQLGDTYCDLTLRQNSVVAIDSMIESPYSGHPCYKNIKRETYIGAPVYVHGEVYGTISLSSRMPHAEPFTQSDREFVRLLAAWVGGVIERERAVEQLRVSEERLARSQSFANIGTWDWNIQTGDLFWSDRIAPLFGYALGEVETNYDNFLAAVHPDDRQLVIDAVSGCVERGAEYNVEHRVVWPDGTVRWLLEKGDVVRGADGTAINMLGVVQDITARKAAEIALRESQLRLEEAQRMAHIGNWEADLETEAVFWSPIIYDIFGRDPDTFKPSLGAYEQAVHPDDLTLVDEAEQRALESGVHDVVHRIVRPDGEIRFVHQLAEVVSDADGKPLSFRGTVQDITERKRAEAALAESEARFRGFFESSPVGIAVNDMNGRFVEVNAAMSGFTGYSREEFLHLSYWQLTPSEYEEAEQEQLHRLRTEGRYGPYEKEYIHKDGHRVPVLLRGRLVTDRNGQPQILSTVIDITDRKAAEERLALFRRIFDASEQAIGITNGRGDFLYTNKAHDDLCGYPFDELEGRQFSILIAPSAAAKLAQIGKNLQHGEGWNGLLPVRRRDGSEFVSVSNIGVILDEGGEPQYLFNILTDYTEELLRQQELQESKEDAERASQAKSEFLSSMSHELRTPMNAILGFTQLLEIDQNLTDDQRDSLNEIHKAGDHLLNLINEVLDLAKIESGRIDLSLEAIGLAELFDESIALVQPLCERKQISLHCVDAGDRAVRADRTRLKQILLNLLSNAIKYNREKGDVELTVAAGEVGSLRIMVRDTGLGIPADRLDELFQPFNRLAAEESDVEGTGIGLVISHRLIDLMGGQIGVESTQGEGSLFWVELPAATAESIELSELAESSARIEDEESRTHTILYVEDNPANLKLVRQILARRKGVHLLTAHEPKLGLELATAHDIDLVLLDINMPEMDGYDVLKILRTNPQTQTLPVVAVTANAMQRDIERGRAAGFDDYLTKPLDIGHFLEVIDRILTQRETSTK